MGMPKILASITLVALLALAGCGDDDDMGAVSSGGEEPLAEATCMGEDEEIEAEYVGLSEQEALDLAAEQELTTREVGRDGECVAITMDLRDDRVNLEIVDGVVVAAAIF